MNFYKKQILNTKLYPYISINNFKIIFRIQNFFSKISNRVEQGLYAQQEQTKQKNKEVGDHVR